MGGGHYAENKNENDQRDYKKDSDFNHKKLDELSRDLLGKVIGNDINKKTNQEKLKAIREKLRFITEYKRSTHAEMSALLDKVIYLHPYPKSKAKEMFAGMLAFDDEDRPNTVNFKSFYGLAPNHFMYAFQNDGTTRQYTDKNGKPKNGNSLFYIIPNF